VLVLGAAGFIGGRALAALAARPGVEVTAAWNRTEPRDAGVVRRLRVDATDAGALAAALAGMEAVVNCVAGGEEAIRRSGEALFAAAAAMAAPPRVVHLSSMAVYGSQQGDVDERAELRGDTGPYAAAKLAVEVAARRYPRAVVLRPGCVYGPGSEQWSGRIGRWLRAGRIGDLGEAGDGWANLVHVDDVVAAIVAALAAPPGADGVDAAAFNLAARPNLRWNEYFARYARALGAVPVRRIPGWRLALEAKGLAVPLKVAELLARRVGLDATRLPEAVPPSLVRLFGQELRLDPALAERRLGLAWTPLDAGLAQSAAWLAARSP
jgi:nucleoside-diphosphate-sugar epimerase